MRTAIKILAASAVCLLLFLLVGGTGLYYWVARDLPGIQKITDYDPPLATTVFTSNGKVLGYLFKEKRFLRRLEEMPEHVGQAFIAAEDSDFYHHEGIDFTSILRAAIANFKAGEVVQGASTITQQVIDALLMDTGTSYLLKLKEAILAYRLDKHLRKEEILTIYLNQIYLGEGAYGVEAAARAYFDKHASRLELHEAALLAGLPKSPSLYNPYRNRRAAKSRQRYVLRRMLETGRISRNRYQRALEAPLELRRMADPSWEVGGYYLQAVRNELSRRFSREAVYRGGLKVRTAVDLKHQRAAERALRRGLEALSKRRGWRGPIKNLQPEAFRDFLQKKPSDPETASGWHKVLVTGVKKSGASVRFDDRSGFIGVESMRWAGPRVSGTAPGNPARISDARAILDRGDVVFASILDESGDSSGPARLALEQMPQAQGALVSLEPESGKVRALVGGYSFSGSQFNRAIQAERQPGSAFKPIVYSAALDHGFTPASALIDAPVVVQGEHSELSWKPRNYRLINRGKVLLRSGLVHSINLATIRLAQEIGVKAVIGRARDLGLEGDLPHDLTISIGTLSVSLMDLCRAYTGFARRGTIVRPRLITRVDDSWGQTLHISETRSRRAISPRNAFIITKLLQQVVRDGTGRRVRTLGRPVAGKTGTTDQQKDAWFIGYTPYLLSGVYVGLDDPRSLGEHETGARAASPVWLDYRREVEGKYPERGFEKPEGIVMAEIDAETGLLAGSDSGKTYTLPFRAGNQPSKIAGRPGTTDSGSLKKIF
jgi:penicillin-binding protein 1A